MLSAQLQGLLWVVVIVIGFLSINKSTYSHLFNTPARQTGVFACALVLALLWRIKAGILPGLDLHILGITAVTLTLGWRLAILSCALATALLTAFGQITPELVALKLIISAFIPVLFTYLVFIVCYHYLARHFFIYIFVCSFLTAGVVACVNIILGGAFYYAIGEYSWHELSENYIYLSPILAFPEAMLNGMAITVLITYRPHWVKTFFDKDYLGS